MEAFPRRPLKNLTYQLARVPSAGSASGPAFSFTGEMEWAS
jgi:hypothetical protein